MYHTQTKLHLECRAKYIGCAFVSMSAACFVMSAVKRYPTSIVSVAIKILQLVHTYWVSVTLSVVMVVGAGRGPLVEATLKAAQTSGRNIRVYAVEKNPGAVNT